MALLLGALQWLRSRGMAHFARGIRRHRTARRLELLEKLPLTAQHSLHVVRVDGRSLLISVSPSGCALLESWTADPAAGDHA
jgi:flagellar biogenesis protein FliO